MQKSKKPNTKTDLKAKAKKKWHILGAIFILLLACICIGSAVEIRHSQQNIDQVNELGSILKTSVADKLVASYAYAHSSYCSLQGTEGGLYFDDSQYCESNMQFTFPQNNPQAAFALAKHLVELTNSTLPASSSKPLGGVTGIMSDFLSNIGTTSPGAYQYQYNHNISCYFSLYYYNKGYIVNTYGPNAVDNLTPPTIPPIINNTVVFNVSCDVNVSKPYLMDPFKNQKSSQSQVLPIISQSREELLY